MPNIIFVNGPPGAGKDTVARYFNNVHGYRHLKFAQPIREAVTRHFNIPDHEIDEWKNKDIGNGKKGRDFMIAYSECYIKPIKGIDWFGVRAAQSIQLDTSGAYVISDAGFTYEVEACINKIRSYAEKCPGLTNYTFQLIQLHREGCSFSGDSRGWVELDGLTLIVMANNGTLEGLFRDIEYIFRKD